MMWEWSSGGAWWWMCVGMLVFWGLVAWVVVTPVRQSRTRRSNSSPQEILGERYARGDIDDDYSRRRSDLIHH